LRCLEEASYRELVENASDIIYAHDLEGLFTWVNRACERVTGYTREEALRMRIWDLVAPEYRAALEHNSGELLEVEIVSKDGRRVPLEVRTRVVYSGQRPVGVQGIARDVSERRQAEAALSSSEDKFRALVEQSLVGRYIIQDGRYVYVNPKFAEIFGYPAGEIEGRLTLADLTWPEDLPLWRRTSACASRERSRACTTPSAASARTARPSTSRCTARAPTGAAGRR
jgi:PAS domain S-box-containing protein